jgi:hypothetical protein
VWERLAETGKNSVEERIWTSEDPKSEGKAVEGKLATPSASTFVL